MRSHPYTLDFEEVKALGGDGVNTPSARTADQTQIALFWLESSPLMWNRIARDISTSRGLDLWESARLFALLNLAMADGYIASWRAKFDYLFWRPVTAIRTADTDGNRNTAGDPTWTPLQPTYPMPDHDSAHSVEGGAAAEALKRFFGTDEIELLRLQLHAAARQQVHRCGPRPAVVWQLLRGGDRERSSRACSSAFTSAARWTRVFSMAARSRPAP